MFVDDPALTAEQRLELLEAHLLSNLQSEAIQIPYEILERRDLVEFCRSHLESRNKYRPKA
jgi:hypothetical protein